jgi:hypothetical protein
MQLNSRATREGSYIESLLVASRGLPARAHLVATQDKLMDRDFLNSSFRFMHATTWL